MASSNQPTEQVRVALYMRVSTAEQRNNFSIDAQRKELLGYIKHKEFKSWITKPSWAFIEQASGGHTDRPELQRLIDQVKQGKFDLVLVWKIDRISRSLSDLLNIFETLHKYNTSFSSVKEDMDFTGPIGRLVFQIFGALAEFERSMIKMRTDEGKRMSALAGNYVGGRVPFGYKKVANISGRGSKLHVVENEAIIVRQIFIWFNNKGIAPPDIARKLNENNVPKAHNVKDTPWKPKHIRNILTNNIYRGQYITNRYYRTQKRPIRVLERDSKDWIIAEVEPIVRTSTFFETQQRLKNYGKGKRGGGKNIYMLSGKIIDVQTQKGFVGYLSGKGTKNYRRKRIQNKDGTVKKTISISAKPLEDFVWNICEKAINQPQRFLELHKKYSSNRNHQHSLENEFSIYERQMSEANKKIDRVKSAYYGGDIDKEERIEFLKRYTDERDSAFKSLESIKRQLDSLYNYNNACHDLKIFSKNMMRTIKGLSYKDKTNLVQMMVEKIEVHDTKTQRKVKVFFRFEPHAIASSIPEGRTHKVPITKHKPKSTSKKDTPGGFSGIRTRDQ